MVSKEQEEQIIKETKKLVKMFLLTKESDIELASKTGLSSSTVGRRLTNKKRILSTFPDKGEKIYSVITRLRKQNALNGKILGAETSKMTYGSDEVKQKLNIKTLGTTESKQYNVLKHLILTYRPKLSLLSELFQISETELYDKLLAVSNDVKDALKYIFEFDNTNQDIAKNNIILFYQDLLAAKKNKDTFGYKEVISRVDDSKFQILIQNYKHNNNLSNTDVELVLQYQIKYCRNKMGACKTLGISYEEYDGKVSQILSDDHKLFSQYKQLLEYLK